MRMEGKLTNLEGEFIASGPCEVNLDKSEVTMWPSWEVTMLERQRGELLLTLGDNSEWRIDKRHLIVPPARALTLRTIEERQHEYGRHAVDLSEVVASRALASARIDARSIGTVISVSCTGYMLPSLEVHLAHRIGLSPAVRRVPIKLVHRMTEKQVKLEMESCPVRHVETQGHLPWQHVIIFEKKED